MVVPTTLAMAALRTCVRAVPLVVPGCSVDEPLSRTMSDTSRNRRSARMRFLLGSEQDPSIVGKQGRVPARHTRPWTCHDLPVAGRGGTVRCPVCGQHQVLLQRGVGGL